MTAPARPPLALTQGDPAGIGPELALKAWLARDAAGLPPFLLLSDPDFMARTARRLGFEVPIVEATPDTAFDLFAAALPILPIGIPVDAEPGRPDPQAARATLRAIEHGVELTQTGRAAAVVTNPIAKHVLYEAGFAYPGHTEYLAALAAGPGAPPPRPVMMLWSPSLAVVPVTVHIPLRDVADALTAELIVETSLIVERDLRQRFGLARPRLAVAGLNPHAGESGTIGREDRDIIAPAITRLKADGLDIAGPWPSDTMFHAQARARYDAALCMYHDQALVPIKTIAFDDAVNVTLGLPFVRTSPDHGTAFDIAGHGIARPDSLIAALKLADRLTSASTARS